MGGVCRKACPAKAMSPIRSPSRRSTRSIMASFARSRRVGRRSVASMLLELSRMKTMSRPRALRSDHSTPSCGRASAIPMARTASRIQPALIHVRVTLACSVNCSSSRLAAKRPSKASRCRKPYASTPPKSRSSIGVIVSQTGSPKLMVGGGSGCCGGLAQERVRADLGLLARRTTR